MTSGESVTSKTTTSLAIRWTLSLSLAGAVSAIALAVLSDVTGRFVADGHAHLSSAFAVLAGLAEGLLFGVAQALGARKEMRWVLATVAAFGIVWAASDLILAHALDVTDFGAAEIVLVAAMHGALLGSLLATLQWLVDRNLDLPLWILANALGWGAAMGLGALVTLQIWGPLSFAVLALEGMRGLSSGLVVGLITAAPITQLPPRTPSEQPTDRTMKNLI